MLKSHNAKVEAMVGGKSREQKLKPMIMKSRTSKDRVELLAFRSSIDTELQLANARLNWIHSYNKDSHRYYFCVPYTIRKSEKTVDPTGNAITHALRHVALVCVFKQLQ